MVIMPSARRQSRRQSKRLCRLLLDGKHMTGGRGSDVMNLPDDVTLLCRLSVDGNEG